MLVFRLFIRWLFLFFLFFLFPLLALFVGSERPVRSGTRNARAKLYYNSCSTRMHACVRGVESLGLAWDERNMVEQCATACFVCLFLLLSLLFVFGLDQRNQVNPASPPTAPSGGSAVRRPAFERTPLFWCHGTVFIFSRPSSLVTVGDFGCGAVVLRHYCFFFGLLWSSSPSRLEMRRLCVRVGVRIVSRTVSPFSLPVSLLQVHRLFFFCASDDSFVFFSLFRDDCCVSFQLWLGEVRCVCVQCISSSIFLCGL